MERNEIVKKLPLQLITQKQTLPEILAEVRSFLEGGGRWVQLRMKEASVQEIVEAGSAVLALCREYGAVFILNDHPPIARQIGADGVHLGREDLSPEQARAMLGAEKIIGCTANTFEEIERLNGSPIDYIGLGPYRFTATKKNLAPVLGAEGYRRILSQMNAHGITLPVVAIGGITLFDIAELNRVGVRYYALSGAISRAENPEETTRQFLADILDL
ncbi:MAG: thiamine phosphate synthase [Rikenellaceae bacterium]|jgi:thiamine-phosphate pyrophosphorylase|nr:thiamine phosphate synthase [Rikenellaceae bacterium]